MFALASLSRDACLRCQLRQAIHDLQRRRLPQYALAAVVAAAGSAPAKPNQKIGSYRHFSLHSIQRYDISRELAQDGRYKQPLADDLYNDQAQDEVSQPAVIPSTNELRHSVPLKAQRRARNAPGYRLRNLPLSTNIPLKDVDLFGDPTSITRLANPERKDPKATDGEEEERVVSEHNEADVLELLEQDSSEPSLKEMIEGIDTIKDRWLASLNPSSSPTSRDCIRIYTQLLESFNSDQLQQYLKATQREDADEFDDLLGIFTSEICTRSKWYVGHTPLLSTSAKRLSVTGSSRSDSKLSQATVQEFFGGKETATTSKKSVYATSIIRKSWRIIAAEESHRSGELDILIPPDIYTFLQSRFDLFHQIEQQCSVKIEFNPDVQVLRVRGPLENCSQAFTAFYAPLCILRTQRIELYHGVKAKRNRGSQPQGPEHLWTTSILNDVGMFTKSHISKVFDESGALIGFEVMFLGPQLTESTVDTTTFDRVRRLIAEIACDQSNRPDIQFLSDSKIPHYQAPIQGEMALPLQHRSEYLYRLRSERAKSDGTKSEYYNAERDLQAGTEIGSKILPLWRWLGSLDNHGTHTKDHQWSMTVTPFLTASTGQIGFDRPEKTGVPFQQMEDGSRNGVGKLRENQHKSNFGFTREKQKLFIPTLPGGISTFDRLNEIEATGEQRIVLTLKASAITEHDSEALYRAADELALPDLQVELEPSEDEHDALVAKGAKLIYATQQTQISLPSQESDLQIASTPFFYSLQDSVVDENTKDFIDQIALRNGRVDERSVPLSLEIWIPEIALMINSARKTDNEWRFKLPGDVNASHTRNFDSEFLEPSTQDSHASLADVDLKHQKQPAQLQKAPPKGCLLVDYQFSRLEHHSRLHGRFQGYPLTYSMVDAGGTGRQWEQLTLGALPATNVVTDLSDSPMPDRATRSDLDRLDQPVDEEYVSLSTSTGIVEAGGKDVPVLVKRAMEASTAAAEKEVKDKQTKGMKAEDVGKEAAETVRAEYMRELGRNPSLAWFLDFFLAALDMTRKP